MKFLSWGLPFLGVMAIAVPCVALEEVINTNFSYEAKPELISVDSKDQGTVDGMINLKKERSKFVLSGGHITKYGYDFVTFRGESAGRSAVGNDTNSVRVRGGFNRFSKDAQVGVQVIVNW